MVITPKSFAFIDTSYSQITLGAGSQSTNQDAYGENTAFLHTYLDGKYPLSGFSEVRYGLKAKLNSSSRNYDANSERTQSNKNTSEFKIVDVDFKYYLDHFWLSGFIVNQKNTNLMSRLSDRGHLALAQYYSNLNPNNEYQNKIRFEASAYQSRILGYTSTGDSTSLPELYVESVSVGIEQEKFKIKNSLRHFSLLNADGSMAYESAILGNSTSGTTAETSRFTHKFSGYADTLEFHFSNIFNKTDLNFWTEYLINTQGDPKNNQALLFNLEVKYKMQSLGVQKFEIGEETLPATLFVTQEQRVNVDGYKVYYSIFWNQFNFSAQFSQSKPIVSKPEQQREDIYYFSVEKNFEI